MPRTFYNRSLVTALIACLALTSDGLVSIASGHASIPIRKRCRKNVQKYTALSWTGCWYVPFVVGTDLDWDTRCKTDTRYTAASGRCLWGHAVAMAYNGPSGCFKTWHSDGLGMAGPRDGEPLDFTRYEPGVFAAARVYRPEAVATFPSPPQCSVEPWASYGHALVSPGDQSGVDEVTVTVRDLTGTPLAGVEVEIEVTGSCLEGRELCLDPADAGLTGVTNALGVVVLDPKVGGCVPCDIAVRADGVTIAVFPGTRSPDWDGTRADGKIDALDLAFLQSALLGSYQACADLNGDGAVTAADLSIFSAAYSAGDANSSPCEPMVNCCQPTGLCSRVPQSACTALGGTTVVNCATCTAPDSVISAGQIEAVDAEFDPISETIAIDLGTGRFVATLDSTYALLEARVWVQRDSADTVSTSENTIWAGQMLNQGGVISYHGGFTSSGFTSGQDGNHVWVEVANATYNIPFVAPGGQGTFDDVSVETIIDGGTILSLTTDVNDAMPGPPELRVAPNPFAASTRIFFEQQRPGPARFRIFDATGRLVRVLDAGHVRAGPASIAWDGRNRQGLDVPPGTYYIRGAGDVVVSVGKIVRID